MEEAQERHVVEYGTGPPRHQTLSLFQDAVAHFKTGNSIFVTDQPEENVNYDRPINLLAYSNRYGYVFSATQNQGLALIPSSHVDRESESLNKANEDGDGPPSQTQAGANSAIIRRAYIPGGSASNSSRMLPQWVALNADESILALVLLQKDTQDTIIIFYDTAKFIQNDGSSPICPPVRLNRGQIGDYLVAFAWNPAIPNILAHLDGNGAMNIVTIDANRKTATVTAQSPANEDFSSSE